MLTPSPEIIQLLVTFAPALTGPTFDNLQVLLWGTILAPGRRTVSSALRALGWQEPGSQSGRGHFGKYHRVFNRARWSPLCLSQLLLGLIVRCLVPTGALLVLLIDETLERRRGPRIGYLGWFRDAVRSTGNKVTFALGIRWCCVCVLTPVPWSQRPWALPFLVVPVLSEKTARRLGKRHRGPVEWAAWVVTKVARWQPAHQLVLVGDGSYSALELIATCQRLAASAPPGGAPPGGAPPGGARVKLVTGLRLDAGLYDFAPAPEPGKSGPKAKKGAAQTKLQARLGDVQTAWQPVEVSWYGGQRKTLEIVSEVCLWYKRGHVPVPHPEGTRLGAGALCGGCPFQTGGLSVQRGECGSRAGFGVGDWALEH